MFGRLRRRPVFVLRALKLYSVSPLGNPRRIDRAALVEGLLSSCEQFFGSAPTKFDIHGPYGISKGRSVGIKAFRNKLAKRGHADYYGLEGGLGEPFGFSCVFVPERDAQSGCDHLLVWFNVQTHAANVLDLAKRLMRFFPANYGYVDDFPADYVLQVESRPKWALFGTSLKENPEHSRWRLRTHIVLEGRVRDIYRCNLLNVMQADALRSLAFPDPVPFVNDVSLLEFTDDDAFEECRSRYRRLLPAT